MNTQTKPLTNQSLLAPSQLALLAAIVLFAAITPTILMTAPAVACLLYTSPSPRDQRGSRMPSSA